MRISSDSPADGSLATQMHAGSRMPLRRSLAGRIGATVASVFAIATLTSPAAAQAVNPYNVSWSALDPGNDWAAQVVRSIFPIPGGTAAPSTGNAATVIGQLVGQFTGFVAAIACAFVAYSVIMNIHRAAEKSRILGSGQTWMFVVRVGFAGIMMFPLGGGFSAGQALVMQAAMTGVGMARVVYTNAIKAVGPDAIVIAQPMIPGTKQIVAGIIDSELCMDLVNLASNTVTARNGPLVPIPVPIASQDGTGGYSSYRYQLSVGNGWGNPVCGTITMRTPATNQTTIAGVRVDMAAIHQAMLNNVLNSSIRNDVARVAQDLWTNKTAASLVPLQAIYMKATNDYTTQLTSAATTMRSAINASLLSNAQQYRSGQSDLLQNQVQQDQLGWTGAGAYYLEIAKLNGTTLALLQETPVVTAPTYQGLGPALSNDLAPLVAAQKDFMATLKYVVQTQDGTETSCGVPTTIADNKDDTAGAGVLTKVFCGLHLSNGVLKSITDFLLPSTQVWTDPFGGLMSLGQTLINTSLIAMGAAALLSNTVTSTGAAIFEFLTLNWGAAAATVAGHAIMSFLGTPIFMGLLAILVPGITIAYVLPMIPWVMWMAGVAGWIILVCEAMIAVPLWMLAHMTVGGDGLHGRATEGWSLLFSVVFRPVLMVIGLFLGYFVFACMSWLIRMTFGVAAGFVLANGWVVSNFIGVAVLLWIFVMTHVVAALMSFRMVALLPHHLPKLIGFTPANRVDMDQFQQRAGWAAGGEVAGGAKSAITGGAKGFRERMAQLRGESQKRIAGPGGSRGGGAAGSASMDSTLRASTDSSRKEEGKGDV